MNAAENNLVQLLTGQPSLQAATAAQIAEITHRFPYFSLGQLLLTKKLKAEDTETFLAQYQQCALYFTNQSWLQYQLNNPEVSKPDKLFKETSETAKEANKETEPELITGEPAGAVAEKGEMEDSNLITLPAEGVLRSISLQLGEVKEEPEDPPLDADEIEYTDILAPEASAKIANLLQHQVEDYHTPVDNKRDLPVSAEPYHTIDYFASQGIKMDPHQPQDALAKKVHTFTDWLKQMKRINQSPTDLGSDPDTDSYVQSIADTSNQPREVHTEAMAEVLIMQGKKDKAIELYQKLSLLNPAKTAYFAAKIHQLKAQ